MDRTFELGGKNTTQLAVAARRDDLGLTEECRQFPHRIAFLCFVGDVVVVSACLLAAFWLRFDTALRDFGVEAPGIVLSSYSNYIIFGSASLLLALAQRQLYEGSWLLHRHSILKDVFAACSIWGIGFLGFSLFFKFQPPLSRVYVALATGTAMIGLYSWRRLFYGYLRQEALA